MSLDPIEQLRQLWITANEESIRRDLTRARGLAQAVPFHLRAEAEDFVVAMERLERWLGEF